MASAPKDARTRAEDALRLAEDNFRRDDHVSARIFAARAQSLCPYLPGVAAALAAYSVHVAAAWRRLPDGSVDHYAVLDARAADGVEAAKKQFKRMCLLTHPDKNPCPAAESAFRLVMKAWDAIQSRPACAAAPQPRAARPGQTGTATPPPSHQSDTPRPRARGVRRSRRGCSYSVWDDVCPFCGTTEWSCRMQGDGAVQLRVTTICSRCKKTFTWRS